MSGHDDDNFGDEGATPYRRRQDDGPRRWRFKREISTGDILLAASLIVAGAVPAFVWGSGVENRLTKLETQATMQRNVDDLQDQVVREGLTRIERAVGSIQDHLLNNAARRAP